MHTNNLPLSHSALNAARARTLRTKCHGVCIVLAGTLVALLGLGHFAYAAEPSSSTASTGGDYQIGPEDILEISVWREKDLQREVLVRPDGWLTFPLVGNVQAAGKTAYQVEQEIRQRLRKFIPDPVVTVTVKKIQGLKIFVTGRVGKPGEYMVGRYIDVLQALTLAGGLTPFAKEDKIKVLRKQGGKEVVIPFDYSEVKKGKRLEQNITLRSGDVIVVP